MDTTESNEEVDTTKETQELFSVLKNSTNNKRSKPKPKQRKLTNENKKRKHVEYPEHIREAEDYILGKRGKPKFIKKAKTMISKTRSEPAANKPLTKGRVQGVEANLFFDSGAESNIDYS